MLKKIYKLIAIILIQCFLVMDIAWAGANKLFSIPERNQVSNLAPKTSLNLEYFQHAFKVQSTDSFEKLKKTSEFSVKTLIENQLNELVQDPKYNKTKDYDPEKLKQDLKSVIDNLNLLPKAVKHTLNNLLKKAELPDTIADLSQEIIKLISSPQLSFYFLATRFGENTFNALFKDIGNKYQVKKYIVYGKDKNLYFNHQFFSTLSISEKLGKIVYGLVLMLGQNQEYAEPLAEEIEKSVALLYDQITLKAQKDELANEIKAYFKIKNNLFEAVVDNNHTQAIELNNQWLAIIENISQLVKIVSKESIKEIIQALGFNPDLATLLVEEVLAVSDREFSLEISELLDDSTEEVLNVLGEEKDKEKLKKQILKNTKPTHITNLIPQEYFEKANFSDQKKRYFIAARIQSLSDYCLANASVTPETGLINVKDTSNLLRLAVSAPHEMVHFLAEKDYLKINSDWEFTTYGGAFAHKIVQLKEKFNLPLEQIEQTMAPIIGLYVSSVNIGQVVYQKGKELYINGNSIFNLKLQAQGEHSYVSIEDLLEICIDIYEENGIECNNLRLYWTYLRRPPQNAFEKHQFDSVRYDAQRVVGILLSGVWVAEYEKTGKQPLLSMADYFKQLDQVFNAATEKDKKWIDQILIPKLRAFVQGIFGSNVDFIPSGNLNEVGFWRFKQENSLNALVEYWRTALVPKGKDEQERLKNRADIEDRAFGHLMLAQYREVYSPSKDFYKTLESDFDQALLRNLFDFLLIPSAVHKGNKGIKTSIDSKGQQKKEKYQLIPDKMRSVFHSLTDFGDEKVDEQILKSYPLHLQYINSLFRIWSHYQGKDEEELADPRVIPGSDLEKAIVNSFEDGWEWIFFYPADKALTNEKILEIVRERIYPEFKKLYDQQQEIDAEKKKKEAEKLSEQLKKLEELGINPLQFMPQPMPGGQSPQDPNAIPMPSSGGLGMPMPGSGSASGSGITPQGKGTPSPAASTDPQAKPGDTPGKGADPKAKPGDTPGKGADPDAKPGDTPGKGADPDAKPGDTPLGTNNEPSDGTGTSNQRIDNSGPSIPNAKQSAISQLTPPKDGDTFNNLLKGTANQTKKKFKRTKRPDRKSQTSWTDDQLLKLDAEKNIALYGLSPEELKIYLAWKRQIPEKLLRQTKEAFKVFLKKYLGRKLKRTDDLSNEWIDIVEIKMNQPGTGKFIKKRPFPVKLVFLVDKSASMGMKKERVLWARLMIMLFYEIMIEINQEYAEIFQWECITYDQATTRVGAKLKDSTKIKKHHSARVVYDTLTALDPGGWTDDKKAFSIGIRETMDVMNKDNEKGFYILLGITDGNFASNPELSLLCEKAEQKSMYIRVFSVGDDDSKQDCIDTFGEKRVLIPESNRFEDIPKMGWEAFLDIFEDFTKEPVRDVSAYLGEGTQTEINPQLKRIFEDMSAGDYYFVQGIKEEEVSSVEGHVGNLFERLHYLEWDEID
ncbi:MAG: hypothetical protein ABIG64_03135, partial [Candidatus Omnitrophota bacterium]